MEGPARPDKIIEEIGGCGRYQIRISVVVHLIKSIAGFSILSTVIICSTPPWRCDDRIVLDNSTSCMILQNESEVNICPSEACVLTNDSKCSSFVFEGTLQTIVSDIIPESFRWYIGHDKTDKALEVINKVAKYNHRHEVELGHLMEKSEVKKDRKYIVIDLFKSKTLIRNTILSIFNWMGLGLVSYGIKYGIQALSGNIFFNLFLFNLCGIPSKGIALWLQNRFGRRITAIICYTIVGISGFIVGVVQTVEAPNRDALTNGFALLANIGITMVWGPVQTMTIELYPTVVRNIGFGTLSVMGRIGAMIGPQLVYLDSYVPGLLYYVCGAVSVVCVTGTSALPETMDADLNDKIGQMKEKSVKNNQIRNGVV